MVGILSIDIIRMALEARWLLEPWKYVASGFAAAYMCVSMMGGWKRIRTRLWACLVIMRRRIVRERCGLVSLCSHKSDIRIFELDVLVFPAGDE